MPEEWSVAFYAEPGGSEPVREFIAGLDRKAQARFDWAIEQLRLRNVHAGEPLVRHLTGKLWELRRESDSNLYRLIYCFDGSRRIVFLHGFQKKTQKTPRREIEVAERRLRILLERQEEQRR
jgi:phage-related protein